MSRFWNHTREALTSGLLASETQELRRFLAKKIRAIKLKNIKCNCWKHHGVHLIQPSTQGKTRKNHMRAKQPLDTISVGSLWLMAKKLSRKCDNHVTGWGWSLWDGDWVNSEGTWLVQSLRAPAWKDPTLSWMFSFAILKFLITFKQRVSHFHFALGPTKYVQAGEVWELAQEWVVQAGEQVRQSLGASKPQISLGSSHLPKTTWSGWGSTRNWTQSCRTPRLMVLHTLLSCLLRWTSHLSRPPDCSYNCSLLFQGDFLDCSGPVMLLLPSFLYPSYQLEPWSLCPPVSSFWSEPTVAFKPPGESWQNLASHEEVLGYVFLQILWCSLSHLPSPRGGYCLSFPA